MTALYLLTGYSSGLGRAVLQRLLKLKDPEMRVALIGRQVADIGDIRVCHQFADLRRPAEGAEAVRFAFAANYSRHVDSVCLIHCAAIARSQHPGEVLTVNFTSVVAMCEAFEEGRRQCHSPLKDEHSVLLVTSGYASLADPPPDLREYACSKRAVEQYSAWTGMRRGNALYEVYSPGAMDTPMGTPGARDPAEAALELLNLLPTYSPLKPARKH